jgi:hypothetical protein
MTTFDSTPARAPHSVNVVRPREIFTKKPISALIAAAWTAGIGARVAALYPREQMQLYRMTLVAVVLALAAVPLAPLYCAGDDPAAMACCAEQANTCNQPTAPDDECCRDAPSGGQTLSAPGAFKVGVPGLSPALDASPRLAVAAKGTPPASRIWWLGLPSNGPARPLSVLRI